MPFGLPPENFIIDMEFICFLFLSSTLDELICKEITCPSLTFSNTSHGEEAKRKVHSRRIDTLETRLGMSQVGQSLRSNSNWPALEFFRPSGYVLTSTPLIFFSLASCRQNTTKRPKILTNVWRWWSRISMLLLISILHWRLHRIPLRKPRKSSGTTLIVWCSQHWTWSKIPFNKDFRRAKTIW